MILSLPDGALYGCDVRGCCETSLRVWLPEQRAPAEAFRGWGRLRGPGPRAHAVFVDLCAAHLGRWREGKVQGRDLLWNRGRGYRAAMQRTTPLAGAMEYA